MGIWDVSRLTSLAGAFSGYLGSSFDLNDWVSSFNASSPWMEVSAVPCSQFCSSLQDVSSVTSLEATFFESSFNGQIGSWDTSRYAPFESYNIHCPSLLLIIKHFFLGRPSVENLDSTFFASAFSGDVSNWVRIVAQSADDKYPAYLTRTLFMIIWQVVSGKLEVDGRSRDSKDVNGQNILTSLAQLSQV